MTYIQSSGGGSTGGDLGRFHMIKPDYTSYNSGYKYYWFSDFNSSNSDGWCDSRHPNPATNTTADPLAWEMVRNDLKINDPANLYKNGWFEAGTYDVFLRFNYKKSSVDYTHFTYPTFTTHESGTTFSTDLPSSSANSAVAFAPTTVCNYFEQGGLFHISLSLGFVFECDTKWRGMYTDLMHGKDSASYSATNNPKKGSGTYGLICTGAETRILKLA